MKLTAGRTAATLVLGTVVLVGTPALALADSTDYPAPTVSGSVASVPNSSSPTVAGTTGSNAALPRTGTDVAIWLLAGAGLTAAGAVMVSVTRQKGSRA